MQKRKTTRREAFSPREAAEFLSIRIEFVYRLIRQNRIAARQIAGRWAIPAAAVDARKRAAVHAPSTPTLEGATNFLTHYELDSIVSTPRGVLKTTATSTIDQEMVGPFIKLKVQAALLRKSERKAER